MIHEFDKCILHNNPFTSRFKGLRLYFVEKLCLALRTLTRIKLRTGTSEYTHMQNLQYTKECSYYRYY